MPALPPADFAPLIQPTDLPHFGFRQARRPSWRRPLTRKTFLQTGQAKAALFPSQSSSCPIELRSIVLTGMRILPNRWVSLNLDEESAQGAPNSSRNQQVNVLPRLHRVVPKLLPTGDTNHQQPCCLGRLWRRYEAPWGNRWKSRCRSTLRSSRSCRSF